jgi:8-oxo-dGTP pyrophosphatase MutT (NUDIX family)
MGVQGRNLDFSNIQAKLASVLILIYQRNGQYHIPLIQRTSHNEADQHRGQIALPGGKFEDNDVNYMQTALRESNEEIGIDLNKVTIAGNLTPLYVGVSNFLIHPYVGTFEGDPQFLKQENEVEEIIHSPINHFFDDSKKSITDMRVRKNIILPSVPYFDIKEKVVWGATAMILSEFIDLLEPEIHNYL